MTDDEEVMGIMTRLLEVKERISALSSEQEALWRAFFAIADERVGENKPYRFFDRIRKLTIARSMAESQILNEAALEKLLGPRSKAWLAITETERRVTQPRLEVALRDGKVAKEAIEKCTDVQIVARRLGPRPASKDDLDDLEQADAGVFV